MTRGTAGFKRDLSVSLICLAVSQLIYATKINKKSRDPADIVSVNSLVVPLKPQDMSYLHSLLFDCSVLMNIKSNEKKY